MNSHSFCLRFTQASSALFADFTSTLRTTSLLRNVLHRLHLAMSLAASAAVLSPTARLAPSRLDELSSLLPALKSAAARASAARKPSLARSYRDQYVAAAAEKAAWLGLIAAVKLRILIAVFLFLIAKAINSVLAFMGAFLFIAAAFQVARKTVSPWTKEYAVRCKRVRG